MLRAAYARTAAATGAFPVLTAEQRAATGALPTLTGPLARMTGELVKLTGAFTALPGSTSRQESGLAALLALASAAASNEGSLNVATEVLAGPVGSRPCRPTGPGRARCPTPSPPWTSWTGSRPWECRRSGSATGTGSRPALTPCFPWRRRRP